MENTNFYETFQVLINKKIQSNHDKTLRYDFPLEND